MDPLTISVGVASLLCSVAKVIRSCNHFSVRCDLADNLLPAIAAECKLMRLGFFKIHDLLESSHESYRDKDDLLDVIENTLAGCSLVLDVLQNEFGIDQQHGVHERWLTASSKMQFIWNETKLRELLAQLRGQQGGLTLILTILQTQSMDMVLEGVRSNANFLSHISRGARSLRGTTSDEEGTYSKTSSIFRFSDAADRRTTRFAFDDEVTSTGPYREQPKQSRNFHSQRRKVTKIRSRSPPVSPSSENNVNQIATVLNHPRGVSRNESESFLLTDPFADPQQSPGTNSSEQKEDTVDCSITTLNIGSSDDIFAAISARNHLRLQAFVDSDIDLSVRNQQGHSALSEAAHLCDSDACRVLIQGRAGPEAQCHAKPCNQARPIHIAAMLNSVAVLQVLLEHGAIIDSLSSECRNALHWAAEHNSPDAGVYLMNAGLDHTSRDSHGNTPLHVAVICRSNAFLKAYLTHEKVDTTKMLELKTTEDKTPVHLAVESGGVDALQLLMGFGAQTEIYDKNNATLLHYAARRSCHEVVHILVSQGQNVNATDRYGQTPLHYAVQSDFDARRTIRVLLDLGADLDARQHSRIQVQRSTPDKGSLARDDAANLHQGGRPKKRKQQSLPTQVEGFHGRTPLLIAALKARAPIVRCLIDAGAHLEALSACGCGALALAKRNKDISVFSLLAESILTTFVGPEHVPLSLKMLSFAVASGHEFDRMFISAMSTSALKIRRHGIMPGSPSGIILRSSEGSCSYNDWSLPHIEAALASCDQAGVSIHQQYHGSSAVERAVLGFQEGQEVMLELLLLQDSSAETLSAIERAQAQLRTLSQDLEAGVDLVAHETFRMLGSRRNELIKELEDDKLKRQQERTARVQKEREAAAERRRIESEIKRTAEKAAIKEDSFQRTDSKGKTSQRPRRQGSDSKDPSSGALRISPLPWPASRKSDGTKPLTADEMRRAEWQSLFGCNIDRSTISTAS